jgi:hypothetical protein
LFPLEVINVCRFIALATQISPVAHFVQDSVNWLPFHWAVSPREALIHGMLAFVFAFLKKL